MKTLTTKTFVTVLFSLFVFVAFGQKNFIEFENIETQRLSSREQQQLSKIQSLAHYKNAQVVIVNSLEKSLQDNLLTFQLPSYSCELKYAYKSSVYKSSDDYSWYGELQGDGETECTLGSIHYIRRNEKTFGQIEVGNDTYEFIDIGKGKHLFYQINDKAFENSYCGVDHNTPVGSYDVNEIETQRVDCPNPNVVSVLVLYTPNSENTVADIEVTAELSVSQMEQAFQNSRVSQNQIELELVDILPYNFTESGPAWQHVGRLASDPAAQTLRTDNSADLVLLLTDTSYGGTLGIVEAIGVDFDGAYALVQAPSAHAKKVFAHEAGHLLGGRHDNDPTGTIEHGYTFRKWFLGKKRGTIMVSGGGVKDKNRILHYSNPDVEYSNRATGTHDENDNETHFENNGPIIAQFFPNPVPDFDARIEGPFSVCADTNSQFEAIVTCGESPHTYLWERSINGVSWTTVSTGSIYNHYQSPFIIIGQNVFTLRLTVTDTTGASIVRQQDVLMVTPPPGFECAGITRASNEINATIYPNPITSNSILSLELDKDYKQLSVLLLNSYGNIVSQSEFVNQKGTLSIPIGNVHLQTGIYYLKIKGDDAETTLSIQIFK